ncbi:TPA: hypothetical protein EYO12_01760 [Candidatus Saccharibacteria bacterium]|nr:hypothetical protein [Candidatus Saccharibacteria bacterium]HIO87443.1 hypothetical protein [Candidatus Saccharibacteria bacterium]
MSTQKQKPEIKTSDYERIGRSMESVVLHGYANRRRLFTTNFLRGLFFGMGSALGATILLALLIFILSLFSEVPLIGRFFENIQTTVEDAQTVR